jgi:glycine cleavage system H protein
VNPALEEDPALVNSAPEDGGWFFKMTIADPGELDALMDEDGYKAFLEGL